MPNKAKQDLAAMRAPRPSLVSLSHLVQHEHSGAYSPQQASGETATMRLAIAGLCLALTMVDGSVVSAREPGVGPSIPPGVTAGQANAVPLTPGWRVASLASYYDAFVVGPNSQKMGLHYQFPNDTIMVTWAADWTILGAAYKAFTLVPVVGANLYGNAPAAPSMRGNFSQFGIANPLLQVADLSWTLGNGFYVNAGFGVFFPIGQYAFNAPINLGAPFWTFEPSASATYYRDGWTVSAQAFYDINTTNPINKYYSGNQLIVNATIMKLIGGFNVGPVAYWSKQVTGDANYGGPRVYGGVAAPPGNDVAVGASISTQFGKVSAQLMFTQDIYVVNGLSGSKGWFNLSYHFQ
jgi:hypothetical protein